MPTNYQRGRSFEYRVRNKLMALGAAYVMRAAQSKGIVDLLALWPVNQELGAYEIASPWLVQAKYSIKGGGYLPPAEVKVLRALADRTGGIPVLARPGKNGRGVEFINLYTKEPIGI